MYVLLVETQLTKGLSLGNCVNQTQYADLQQLNLCRTDTGILALNKDAQFTKGLSIGNCVNQTQYAYWSNRHSYLK